MKNVKVNNRSMVHNTVQKLMATLMIVVVLMGCTNDDGEGDSLIKTENTSFTIQEVNNCSTSIGDGTILTLVTPYTAPDGLVISRIRLKATVSNGESEKSTSTNFKDTGNTVTLEGCFTFGSQQWVEYEVQLESSDGSLSNVSKIRVNKPNGAN